MTHNQYYSNNNTLILNCLKLKDESVDQIWGGLFEHFIGRVYRQTSFIPKGS